MLLMLAALAVGFVALSACSDDDTDDGTENSSGDGNGNGNGGGAQTSDADLTVKVGEFITYEVPDGYDAPLTNMTGMVDYRKVGNTLYLNGLQEGKAKLEIGKDFTLHKELSIEVLPNPELEGKTQKITLTTTEAAVGKPIGLEIKIAGDDAWIDLNNNGVKDEGEAEAAKTAELEERLNLPAKTFSIYGRVYSLVVRYTKLSALKVENGYALTRLHCSSDALQEFRVADLDCPNLRELSLGLNESRTLDLTRFPNLTELSISNGNSIGLVDPGNVESIILPSKYLVKLKVVEQPLRELDLSGYPCLSWLSLIDTHLKSLDVSPCSKARNLNVFLRDCSMLASVNLANGNNTNTDVEIYDCKDLKCIKVDKGFDASKWTIPTAVTIKNDGTSCP
ncbi:MAG: hypothetical protein CSA97_03600 [Bacteroidetes bacterium]|nr:MAG: hypothetical protein CSA97_03600 [Bacteroidota bacterium]